MTLAIKYSAFGHRAFFRSDMSFREILAILYELSRDM